MRASEDRFREDILALHRVHRFARVAGRRRRERLRRPYLAGYTYITYRPRARKAPGGKAKGAGASYGEGAYASGYGANGDWH